MYACAPCEPSRSQPIPRNRTEASHTERLRQAHFTEDESEPPLPCRWHNGALTLDVLQINEEVLGYTNIWYEPALRYAFTIDTGHHGAIFPGNQNGSI